jgi:hypothetical protein
MGNWISPPKFGDLVVDAEGYLGIVVGVQGDSASGLELVVFLANGLSVERPADEFRPRRLPKSTSVCNFSEILKSPDKVLG